MSKELKALERIKREAGTPYFSTLYDIDMWRGDFKEVEKALKVLEIIREKRVDIDKIYAYEDLTEYISFCYYTGRRQLTQEEYDLLKEVLK